MSSGVLRGDLFVTMHRKCPSAWADQNKKMLSSQLAQQTGPPQVPGAGFEPVGPFGPGGVRVRTWGICEVSPNVRTSLVCSVRCACRVVASDASTATRCQGSSTRYAEVSLLSRLHQVSELEVGMRCVTLPRFGPCPEPSKRRRLGVTTSMCTGRPSVASTASSDSLTPAWTAASITRFTPER